MFALRLALRSLAQQYTACNRLQLAKQCKVQARRFQGVTVKSVELDCSNDAEFEQKLTASLEEWKKTGVRGVTLEINIKDSSFVPICVKHGFVYHHAQPDYVLMTRWLPEHEPNNFPAYANQYLGSAGFVVNEKQEVLVVKERFHTKPHWKLPGGHADPGEDIGQAAVREVFEETGIQCEFHSVICFRHMQGYRYGCSDFYFICLLHPLSKEITQCAKEIADSKWMPLEEYLEHPDTSPANRYFAQRYKYLQDSGQQLRIRCQPVLSFDKKRHHLVYSIFPEEEDLQPFPPAAK